MNTETITAEIPTISVLIAVYNGLPYVESALCARSWNRPSATSKLSSSMTARQMPPLKF